MATTMRTRLGLAFAGALLLLGAIVYLTYRSTDQLIQSGNEAGDATATMAFMAVTALSLIGLVALGSLFIVIFRYTKAGQEAVVKAESERLSSEKQYRMLVEQVKDYAIFAMDPRGRATSWNEGVKRVLGYDESEFLGMSPEAIFTPEDVAADIPWKELETAASRGAASNDRWMIRKNKSRFFATGITTALHNERGQLIGFSKVMRDQTTWKRTEDALRDSETRYRLVAMASREAIYDWDLASNGLSWNEGAESLFGYRREEILPTIEWWRDRIHPEERQRVIDSRQTAIDRQEEFWSADYRFRKADGQYATVTDRGVVARTPSGQPHRMLGTMADVTERRRTDEKLSQAQRMEAVGRLAGGIAHDLNNMLTAIVGYSTFLERDMAPDDPRRSDITEIQKAADRSASLTRSLLAFARREMIQPAPLDLNAIVLEMGRMLRPAVGESINVEMALEPIRGTVYADRARLEQVILNIALNARDAMPTGGRLSISTRSVVLDEAAASRHPGTEISKGRYVKLTISDTGHGMESTTLARVFEPFYTTKGVGEGTGLGLSTVYGTVKQAGGFVWAYSEPGHGSAFTVYLPEMADPAAPCTETDHHKGTEGGNETILVVEDEETVRMLSRRTLESRGYRAITAGNGSEALELLQQLDRAVDLVMIDIVMPGMAGRELGERVRQLFPSATMLYTSGFTDDEVIRRGLMESGQPFLQKPWSAEQLLQMVRELLDQRRDRTGWDNVTAARPVVIGE